MSLSANALAISWLAWASDWQLDTATNPAAPVVWAPVTNAVVTNEGQFDLTFQDSSGTRFFRLSAS